MTKAKNREFMQLYEMHHKELSNFCRSLEHDPEDAKELMSETISRAFMRFNNLRDQSKFKSFLFGIASNTLKEFIRKKSRPLPEPKVINLYGNESKDAENHTINQILGQIPAKQAEAFVLYEIVDMSLIDIAKSLDINLSTVKTRLSRARVALAELLHDEFKQHITNY
jgi:RNA polymerase sigma-70 factor (ECF subfamily)